MGRASVSSPHGNEITGQPVSVRTNVRNIQSLAGDLGWEALLDRERRDRHGWTNHKIVGVEELRHGVKDAVARALRVDDLFGR